MISDLEMDSRYDTKNTSNEKKIDNKTAKFKNLFIKDNRKTTHKIKYLQSMYLIRD